MGNKQTLNKYQWYESSNSIWNAWKIRCESLGNRWLTLFKHAATAVFIICFSSSLSLLFLHLLSFFSHVAAISKISEKWHLNAYIISLHHQTDSRDQFVFFPFSFSHSFSLALRLTTCCAGGFSNICFRLLSGMSNFSMRLFSSRSSLAFAGRRARGDEWAHPPSFDTSGPFPDWISIV